MRCEEHTPAPRGRLRSIITELGQWKDSDLANLSDAIVQIIDSRGSARPSIKQIKETVAAVTGIGVDVLSSERRERDVKRARKVAMALCRHMVLASYPRIAKAFGREFGSARRACRQLKPLLALAAGAAPAGATAKDLAIIMLANYERLIGID